ncbi:MAG: Crp/Fnr family transcriptional regulator [Bacteroidota bacterium]
MEALQKYIEQFVVFSEEEWDQLSRRFRLIRLKRGDFFCQQGEVCNWMGFIEQGVVRSYYCLNNQEITRFILCEGVFVTALASFVQQKPSRETIHAIEPTRLWTIGHQDLEQLYLLLPKLERLGRKIMEQSQILLEQRVLALLSFTAEERYRLLMREYPQILQRVPLHYIASLLGMKPETLSRVRRKI